MTPENQMPDFSKLTEDFVYGSLALSQYPLRKQAIMNTKASSWMRTR